MSDVFTRTDRSHIARWWWTVDRWTLVALAVLIGFGLLLVSAASTQIAERLNHQTFYFVEHQAFMLIPTVAVMFGVSLLGPRDIRRLALITLGIFLALTFATFFIGTEIKGATRWITLGPLSLQPSEFVKPAFAVVSAWLFARQHTARAAGQTFHGNAAAIVLLLLVIAVLMAQPDFGMTFVCAAIWFAEFFLAGLPIVIVLGVAVLGVGLLVGAYYLSPHVALRVHMFLDGNAYQVKRSIAAFVHGG
jgi:cell division protein FtsW